MTPDRWCLVNVGANSIDGTIENLNPIFILLDYFGLYFREKHFGHPAFVFEEMKSFSDKSTNAFDEPLNLDIRIWLNAPSVVIPTSSLHENLECLAIQSDHGIFYQ